MKGEAGDLEYYCQLNSLRTYGCASLRSVLRAELMSFIRVMELISSLFCMRVSRNFASDSCLKDDDLK
jgi:hypothetical protein